MKFSPEQTEILLTARTGVLTDHDKMFYDLSFDRFVHIDQEGKLHFLKEKAAVRRAYELVDYKVKGKYIVEELPNNFCVFNPKKPGCFYEEGSQKYFNFFEEPEAFTLASAKTKKSKDLAFIKNHKHYNILLKNLFVKEEYLEYFINWLSTIINEKIKTRTTIILKGVEGTGKGVLWEELITPIFSEYCVTIENESLRSQFNGQLENKLFVLFNEIKGDFRESATLYEKLKIYITDSTISINNKYGGAGVADNNFNCIFYSNNDLPVQISPTDRRYSVFNTSGVTLQKICDNMGITTDTFVKGLRKERKSFIKDLFAYKYEVSRACRVLHTEEKEIIAESTTPKIALISKKLKAQDFDWLFERGMEILETMEIDINGQHAAIVENLRISFVDLLENHLTKGFVANEDLVALYRLFVNFDETSSIKIANAWTPFLGKATVKKVAGKAIRVRLVGEQIEWTVNSKKIEEQQNPSEAQKALADKNAAESEAINQFFLENFGSVKSEVVEDKSEVVFAEKLTKEQEAAGFLKSLEKSRANYDFKVKKANPMKTISEEEFDFVLEKAYGVA